MIDESLVEVTCLKQPCSMRFICNSFSNIAYTQRTPERPYLCYDCCLVFFMALCFSAAVPFDQTETCLHTHQTIMTVFEAM